MARNTSLAAVAACVVMFAVPARPADPGDRATEHLDRAVQLLLTPPSSSQSLREGFLSLLDALLVTAPDAPSAAVCRPKLEKARQIASAGSVLDDRIVELLGACYRDTHDGVSFQVPDVVRSQGDAVGYCRAQLQSARELLQLGRRDAAFVRMIEATVFIVTPVERTAGAAEPWIQVICRRCWAIVRAIFLEGFGWLSNARSSSSG
jgi:hypothetical protein